MKTILFVETYLDYETAMATLRQNVLPPNRLLVVNLNAGNEMDFTGTGVTYKTENDYIQEDTLAGINEIAMKYGRTWFLDPELQPLLEVDGLNIGLIAEDYFIRQLISTCKYVRLIKEILRRENCDEVMLIAHPLKKSRISSLLPSNEEKFANDTVDILGVKESLKVRTLASMESSGKVLPQDRSRLFIKKLVEPWMNLLRKMANKFLSKDSRAVAFVGAPRLIFPILKGFKDQDIAPTYFQNELGPRIVPKLLARGVRYCITGDFRAHGEAQDGNELRQGLTDLIKNKRFWDFFTFEGVSVAQALLPRLHYVYEEYLPMILRDVRRFKRFFQQEGIQAIVIDESVKKFGRPFILAANSRGIPSMEIQHGIPSRYVHHRMVTTKLATWGDYCKSRYIAESGINASDMVTTGCPTLDNLRHRDRIKDIELVRRRLGVKAQDRIITYAAMPYLIGSRGGVIDEHLTRDQVEHAMKVVCDAVQTLPDVHLVIKCHHIGPDPQYVWSFLQRLKFSKPYSVEQAFEVYPLLQSSSAFISLGSTAILEALVLRVPVALIQFVGTTETNPYAEWKAVMPVARPSDMHKVLTRLLQDPDGCLREMEEGRVRILRELACDADGQSEKRCSALVKNLLEGVKSGENVSV